MRKIDSDKDNFLDNIFIDFSEFFSPFFFYWGFTPNLITTLSLITGLISIYFLFYDYVIMFAIFWIISYFFDCFDGYFARKYKMVSKFGEYYDIIKDFFVFALFLVLYIIKYRKHKYFYFWSFILIFLLLAVPLHMGCQQMIYEKKTSEPELLDNYIFLLNSLGVNKNNCNEFIQYTKFLGVGTLQLAVIFIILFFSVRL